jgi:hypothetical protein
MFTMIGLPLRSFSHFTSSLVLLFFCGGLGGAVGFQRFGFLFMAPLAAGLLLLAFVPAVDDLRARTLERRF